MKLLAAVLLLAGSAAAQVTFVPMRTLMGSPVPGGGTSVGGSTTIGGRVVISEIWREQMGVFSKIVKLFAPRPETANDAFLESLRAQSAPGPGALQQQRAAREKCQVCNGARVYYLGDDTAMACPGCAGKGYQDGHSARSE